MIRILSALVALFCGISGLCEQAAIAQSLAASSSLSESPAGGAMDGDRFGSAQGAAWQGQADAAGGWWWQVTFSSPRRVGSILQINGQAGDVLAGGPRDYVWQFSHDGQTWSDLNETRIVHEQRVFRLHRLPRVVETQWLRLRIDAAMTTTSGPFLREVEVYPETDSPVAFPDWLLSVNITDRSGSQDGLGHLEVTRAASTDEWLPAQHVDVSVVSPEFVTIEPRPVCMFLSGSYKDWCEVDRSVYRGVEQILTQRRLPIWGSCGGCQLLAILADTGTDRPWDCPHCRDPQSPKLPIYTHIHCGHAPGTQAKCGVYDTCEFERGPYELRIVHADPIFAGLPSSGQFTCQESHCGQVEFLPTGWTLLATHGPGGKTKNQLMKVADKPIYAAQFHIDMGGEHAKLLAKNFLDVARDWQRRRSQDRAPSAPATH
jgi:hypothetical protein